MKPMQTDDIAGRIAFLERFSEEEWRMNGHDKADVVHLRGIYDTLLESVSGSYMELGCGTGIVCSYVHEFASEHPAVAGMDISEKAIALAARNNQDFSRCFSVGDYLRCRSDALAEFSTINVNVLDNTASVRATANMLGRTSDTLKPGTKVIIFGYGLDFRDGTLAAIVTESAPSLKVVRLQRVFCVLERQ